MSILLKNIWDNYTIYNGSGSYMLIILMCYAYFILRGYRDCNEAVKKILMFSLLVMLVYWCPITAYIIMEFCIGEEVYWRMLWMLPAIPVIGFTITDIARRARHKLNAAVLLVAAMAVIIVAGSSIYGDKWFSWSGDIAKLPYRVSEICDMILEDAEQEQKVSEEGLDSILINAEDMLVTYIAQYDGRLRTDYSREALRNEWYTAAREELASDRPDYNRYLASLDKECRYCVLNSHRDFEAQVDSSVYRVVGEVGDFTVYRIYR